MQKIILYSQNLRKVGGLTTFDINFCKALNEFFDITYIYQEADPERLEEISHYAKVIQDTGLRYDADICVFSTVFKGQNQPLINARRFIQVCHADLRFWYPGYRPEPHYEHVAVGDSVQLSLSQYFGIESIVIPNIMTTLNPKPLLRFITASRIAEGKGFERMVKFAEKLAANGKLYTWEIYGTGTDRYVNDLKEQFKDFPDVLFMGERIDIASRIAAADFLIQFSDNEGFCYSVHEALQVGTPCIITPFSDVIEHGTNGYVVDIGLNNVDIERIYSGEKLYTTYQRPDATDPVKTWCEFLNQ